MVGFGFVTFENEDVVEKVCEIHFHEINNKMPWEERGGFLHRQQVAQDGDRSTGNMEGVKGENTRNITKPKKRCRLLVECKKAQPKEVMFPPGTRGRARGLPYTMDAFMLGMGMLGYPNFVATYGRGYPGFAPSYSYQFPGYRSSSQTCRANPTRVDGSITSQREFSDWVFGYDIPSLDASSCIPVLRALLPYLNASFPAAAYGPVAAAAVAAARGSVLNSYSAQPNFGAPASPAGSNPARPGGFPGANSPGPVADLYGTASQDSGVGNYISAASPQPGSGFGHGIAGPLIATAFTNGYH
ncbi:hypothetical protein Q9233_002636 [Columba guinea]|nr:hypothetical protein Q9233_002636 [Columba guinea]